MRVGDYSIGQWIWAIEQSMNGEGFVSCKIKRGQICGADANGYRVRFWENGQIQSIKTVYDEPPIEEMMKWFRETLG